MDNKVTKAPDYLEDNHLSPQTKEYLKVLNAGDTPVESLSPENARKVLEGAQSSVEVDLSGIEETDKTITEDIFTVKLKIVRPKGKTEKLPVFIFIHGGGWVLGDYPTHRRLVRDLVIETGYAAVFVDYTRSPEAKYPQAVNEIYAATKWVAEHGNEINVDGSRLGIIGNSVGGNMSLVTSIMANSNNNPKIKVQVLLWPVTDGSMEFDSYEKFGEQRFLTSSLMKWMFEQYKKTREDVKDIHFSPLRAPIEELEGLPPTLIAVAENDILRNEGEAMGRKLEKAGVDVTTIRFNGVIHDWGMLNGFAHLHPTKTMVMFSAAMLKKYL